MNASQNAQQSPAPAPETAVAVPQKKPVTVRDLISGDQFKQQVALALPKHLTADRFTRVALTALNRTPKLADCSRESLFQCLLDLSALGLEPDGRRAHLIPYGDKCTLIIDYKGKVELLMRSGEVSHIHADVVCDADAFDYNLGEITQHKIDFRKPRGEVYAAYCIVRLKDGTTKAEVMSKAEVESVRSRSRSGNNGPWKTDWNEMAKKTVFHRCSKWLPLSPELREKLDKDESEFTPIEIDATVETAPARPVFKRREKKADATVTEPTVAPAATTETATQTA